MPPLHQRERAQCADGHDIPKDKTPPSFRKRKDKRQKTEEEKERNVHEPRDPRKEKPRHRGGGDRQIRRLFGLTVVLSLPEARQKIERARAEEERRVFRHRKLRKEGVQRIESQQQADGHRFHCAS